MNNYSPGTFDLKSDCDHKFTLIEEVAYASGQLFQCDHCNGHAEEYIRNWKDGKNLCKNPILEGQDLSDEIRQIPPSELEVALGDWILDNKGMIRNIWGDDMPDLPYENIVRHATLEERLTAEGITMAEYRARESYYKVITILDSADPEGSPGKSYVEVLKEVKKLLT